MTCPKQEKVKGFWNLYTYDPKCSFKIISIGKFMYSVNTNYFEVQSECKYCGRPRYESFVKWDSLLIRKVPNEIIMEANKKFVYLTYKNNTYKKKTYGE